MIEDAAIVLLFLTFIAFSARRGLTYLHIYQQEEYDSGRFLKWIFKNRAFDKRLTAAMILVSTTPMFLPILISVFAAFLVIGLATYFEKDPRRDSKKKLVMTSRAQRIYFPALIMIILSSLWCFVIPSNLFLFIFSIQAIPFAIMLINLILAPFEFLLQRGYWTEAHNKVQDLRPTVIAITGSYGKTSVKHILGHILKMQAPTLIMPGSINTPMGITRIIRRRLVPQHKYLIVEMGAYGRGSIERLCKLTPPDMGIITAVGHAHYERFKTLDAVAETKYELAQAVLRKDDGKVIAHERTLRFDKPWEIRDANPDKFIVCGDEEPAGGESYMRRDDLAIKDVTQLKIGLVVNFTWKDKNYEITAPLFGVHHGHNLVLAYVAALELGIDKRDIQTALSRLPQIQHRLEVKKQSNGTTIIDDAYNSNPSGFISALDLLGTLGKDKRKILITPGMVEMGKAHKEAHEKVGTYAGKICDVALVVQAKRIPSFVKSFETTSGGKTLIKTDSFDEAQKWVSENQQDGDVILVENDLPDLYERVPKI